MGMGPAPATRMVLEKAGPDAEGHRSHRGQRSVRRAVPGGREGARARSRPGQRQRRRHRARPSARHDRHAAAADADARAAPPRAEARPRDRLHRRRPGDRGDRGDGLATQLELRELRTMELGRWKLAAGSGDMMQIKTVGVLGCGLMGAGIAQVCAAAGYKTIVREVEEPFLTEGPRPHREVPRRRRREREGHRGGEGQDARQPVRHDEARGPDGLRPGHRGHRRERRGEGEGLRGARRRRRRARDLLLEHLVALHHRAGREDEAARIGSPGCTSSTRCR